MGTPPPSPLSSLPLLLLLVARMCVFRGVDETRASPPARPARTRHPPDHLLSISSNAFMQYGEAGKTDLVVPVMRSELSDDADYFLYVLITSHCCGDAFPFTSAFRKVDVQPNSQLQVRLSSQARDCD